MSLEQYLWRVKRVDNGLYETEISPTEPTVAPSDGGAIVPMATSVEDIRFFSRVEEGYINLQSTLADNQAIKITASDAAGGIDMDAGTGGITIDTTNVISLDAGAVINITTTAGNITIDTPALINLNGVSGINMGNNADAAPVNIGTGAASKTITVGNSTGTTGITCNIGTGNFTIDTQAGGAISLDSSGAACNWTLASTGDGQDLIFALTGANNSSIIIDSAGTGDDSIRLNAGGGIDIDAMGPININTSDITAGAFMFSCGGTGGFDMDLGSSGFDLDTTGEINLATSKGTGGAITLDAATNNGGITLSSGSQGIGINSGSGLIGIGHVSAGDIDIGTSATARTVTMGNVTTTTSVIIDAGTGGVSIGDNSNAGPISIGDAASAKDITIGNVTGASSLTLRHGTDGLRRWQPAETSLSNSGLTLTIAQLKTQILTQTPTTNRTLTLPTAALAVTGLPGVAVDDCIDFRIMNLGTGGSDPTITVAMGTSGTAVGHMDIEPHVNNANTYFYSGTAVFRMRFTNVTASSEAYTLYRFG